MRELEGYVALVTGGPRNIGRAIAMSFANAGASVVVTALSDIAGAQAVIDEIKAAGGQGLAVSCDVTREEDVARLHDEIAARFGRLDILVNNAAVRGEVPFAELDHATWSRILSICLDGAFHCTQAALPLLKEAGGATVVNIGGLTAHTGAVERTHVVTAKAGLVGMTRALAHELAGFGITVNNVAPGMMDTKRGVSAGNQQPRHHATQQTLLGRRGHPDEIAAAVRWLAGPGGRFVTGQVIHVNGGAYLGG